MTRTVDRSVSRSAGAAMVAIAALVTVSPGCAVPQRPGGGQEFLLQEPQSKASYWLYLPKDYAETDRDAVGTDRKHSLVMTFHGMKPFDNAHAQCREWQQEADRYGFVVCAPELRAPDLHSPLPLNRVTGALQRDERAILAIMDEVVRTVDVDPNAVLVTSWSYGGYVAHYMLNRHPQRFSCLVAKQSNFSADILDPTNVPRYRDCKVAVFYTENDFAICQRESQDAAIWYSQHGFDLTFAEFGDKGHERTPSLAASFFARACGVQAKTPPLELASLRVKEPPVLDRTDGKAAGLSSGASDQLPEEKVLIPSVRAAGRGSTEPAAAGPQDRGLREIGHEPAETQSASTVSTTRRPRGFTQWRPMDSVQPLHTRPLKPIVRRPSAPRRVDAIVSGSASDNPVRVRLSSTIGIAPLVVSYSVALPDRIRRRAYFLWTDNNEPLSNGINGQLFLTAPGEHEIKVLVTTENGQEYSAARTVTVLERIRRNRKSE